MSTNFKPYGTTYDHETRTSIVFDRCFRPIVKIAGRYPRCDYKAAVACDGDAARLHGAANTAFLYHDDNAPRCDPIVRRRLADLSAKCPVLAAEVERRSAEPNDLIALTFNVPAISQREAVPA